MITIFNRRMPDCGLCPARQNAIRKQLAAVKVDYIIQRRFYFFNMGSPPFFRPRFMSDGGIMIRRYI